MSNNTARRLLRGLKGMTLVEVMIAMVILMFVALALITVLTAAIDANMKNALMDEAAKAGAERMNRIRNMATSGLTNTTVTEARTVRNVPVTFTLTSAAITSGANVVLINTMVTWQWKGQNYNYLITSLRR